MAALACYTKQQTTLQLCTDILTVDPVVRAAATEDLPARATMMLPPNHKLEFLIAAMAVSLLAVRKPLLQWAQLFFQVSPRSLLHERYNTLSIALTMILG